MGKSGRICVAREPELATGIESVGAGAFIGGYFKKVIEVQFASITGKNRTIREPLADRQFQ